MFESSLFRIFIRVFFVSPFSPSPLRDKGYKEYSLMGKTGNSKLQIISSSLNALVCKLDITLYAHLSFISSPLSLPHVPSPSIDKEVIATVVYKEYSLMGKIGSFKLQISSSSLGALVYITLITIFWFFSQKKKRVRFSPFLNFTYVEGKGTRDK